METPNEEKKNRSWGGARRGAGRPKGDSCASIALRIPQDVAEILSRQPNRSAYIVEAIRAYARTHPDQ